MSLQWETSVATLSHHTVCRPCLMYLKSLRPPLSSALLATDLSPTRLTSQPLIMPRGKECDFTWVLKWEETVVGTKPKLWHWRWDGVRDYCWGSVDIQGSLILFQEASWSMTSNWFTEGEWCLRTAEISWLLFCFLLSNCNIVWVIFNHVYFNWQAYSSFAASCKISRHFAPVKGWRYEEVRWGCGRVLLLH